MTEINELAFSITNILSLSVRGPIAFLIVPAVASILIAVAVRILRRPESGLPSVDTNKRNSVQKTGPRRPPNKPGTIVDGDSSPLPGDHPRASEQLHIDEVRTESLQPFDLRHSAGGARKRTASPSTTTDNSARIRATHR